jgi:hypothetical protein
MRLGQGSHLSSLTKGFMKHRQKVLDLKPTQFAVGMLEVEEKIEIVRGYGRKQIRDFVDENPIPVVVGPQGDLYIVDHHHFLAVCYYVGIKKVRIRVVRNLSKKSISYAQFWKWMFKSRNAYPFCQFGEGPRKAIYLPKDIRGLADDPYRSLAWFVRKAGAFENSGRNFAEFKWANFFRQRRLLDRYGLPGIRRALVRAVALAKTPAAKDLPGFGKLNLEEKVTTVKKIKKKGAQLKARLV